MPSLNERATLAPAEADHRIANNLASLNCVIRLQRNAISKGNKNFTSEQVCSLLDDIAARIEVTAKLHKSLAQAAEGSGVNLGDFLQEISKMIATLGPEGHMDLSMDQSCDGYIEPRHALHAGLIRTSYQCQQVCSSERATCEGQDPLRNKERWIVRSRSN